MRKNTESTKKRRARAKRGMKNFLRKKRSKDGKYLRVEKIRQVVMHKGRKLQELIDKLSGEKGSIVDQEMKAYVEKATNPSPEE